MKEKVFVFVALALLLVAVAACSPSLNQPIFGARDANPQAAPTSLSGSASGPVAVVTATGVPDIGVLLGKQPMTPVAGPRITWDHLLKIGQWRQDTGLSEAPVLYAQSSKVDTIDIPMLEGQTTFVVPQDMFLEFGGYTVALTLGNGKSYNLTKGFYGAVGSNATVSSMKVTNGFLLLVKSAQAQAEYCARIAQAINEHWALSTAYRPNAWTEPVCEGVVTTPIGDTLASK